MLGPTLGWHKAQIQYLTKVRRRPGLARQEQDSQPGVATLGQQAVPSGSGKFHHTVCTQCANVTVNGLLAAFRSKAWVHAKGWFVSLGTIGTERMWRNTNRMTRNKGRSHASLDTVNDVLIRRWLQTLQGRMLLPESRSRHENVAYTAQHALSCERLAGALSWTAAGANRNRCEAEDQFAHIYGAFKAGRIA